MHSSASFATLLACGPPVCHLVVISGVWQGVPFFILGLQTPWAQHAHVSSVLAQGGHVLTLLHEQHLLDAAWADTHTAPRGQHLIKAFAVGTANPHSVPGQPRGWQIERLQPIREA